MTNKNGTVVPTAQELQTFLPVDSVNGVTKWVFIYIQRMNEWINQTANQSINQFKCSNRLQMQVYEVLYASVWVRKRKRVYSNLECSNIRRRRKVKRIVRLPKEIFSIIINTYTMSTPATAKQNITFITHLLDER